MKVHPDCIPCLMKRVFFQSKLPGNGKEEKAVMAALRTYADNLSYDMNSAKLATLVHCSAYEAMEVRDPYIDLKIRADEVAEEYLEELQRIICDSKDSLETALKISIIGNIMDFGSGIAIDDPEEFRGMFSELAAQDIELNDIEILRGLMDKTSSVVYIFDNCGESQIDKLLIREIRKAGKRVVGVVRGEPILNDVAIEDALRIDLDKEVDRLLTTGVFAIGIDMERIDQELRDEIDNADLIIAKGMANYESLSDEDLDVPIVFILKAKCIPVADSLGVSLGANVINVRQ